MGRKIIGSQTYGSKNQKFYVDIDNLHKLQLVPNMILSLNTDESNTVHYQISAEEDNTGIIFSAKCTIGEKTYSVDTVLDNEVEILDKMIKAVVVDDNTVDESDDIEAIKKSLKDKLLVELAKDGYIKSGLNLHGLGFLKHNETILSTIEDIRIFIDGERFGEICINLDYCTKNYPLQELSNFDIVFYFQGYKLEWHNYTVKSFTCKLKDNQETYTHYITLAIENVNFNDIVVSKNSKFKYTMRQDFQDISELVQDRLGYLLPVDDSHKNDINSFIQDLEL